ncbi:MAG: hypothetical protein KBF73_03760 [Flavobacteriales bacterium]|nr:hypothetical protein [Flavobacteriales bacterium]
MLSLTHLLLASATILLFASCEDDHLDAYEKPITSMFYVLTPDSGQKVILSFIDNDGVGGQPALVNTATIKANTTYRGELIIGMLNPMASPRLEHFIDSTSVASEPELHQVFFTPTNRLDISVTYTDTDANGNPIGMQTVLQTGQISEGELQIAVIHSPDKLGRNVQNGDRTYAKGTIDAEAIFTLKIAPE